MQAQPVFEFQWGNPLGISTILFLLYGVMNVVIGLIVPFLSRGSAGRGSW
jgi:hypothetical protein